MKKISNSRYFFKITACLCNTFDISVLVRNETRLNWENCQKAALK